MPPGFRHESLFYRGDDEFLAGTVAPIEQALRRDRPVLVAVAPERTVLLRRALGPHAQDVAFADMRALGRNPARIIPAWRSFLDQSGLDGDPVLGIGEPAWPQRNAEELAECQRHEVLINFAFGDGRTWTLLCPYDVEGLSDDVLEAARESHPYVASGGESVASDSYREGECSDRVFAGGLHKPQGDVAEFAFSLRRLAALRARVAELAGPLLARDRCSELVLAVSELATNSVRYGGGGGTARLWREDGTLLCEIGDGGRLRDPLAGRVRPQPEQPSGRGLWLVNQLCDLVQIRSCELGTVVRLHMQLAPAG